jgi:ABC-2 type transport system ATP-binding protein
MKMWELQNSLIQCDNKREEKFLKLEVKNLKKSFAGKEVLHGISFSVESGKALGLLGRNGAGKTTTIRILMDVFRANEGEILLDGKPFVPRNHQIGYLPEERGLYPKRKVLEQMVYLAMLRNVPKTKAKENAKKWLERLEIGQYENNLLETLSKGNQQKVQLASVLVCDPEIVILDEPFSGLDPVNSQILQDVVKELIAVGKIVIFSSHQMSYVEEFCEDIVIINQGQVVLEGNLNEIKLAYGRDQLILGDRNKSVQEFKQFCEQELTEILQVCGQTKDALIVKLLEDQTRKDLLKALLEKNVEVEQFETYKPSLNDIFVEKVGD